MRVENGECLEKMRGGRGRGEGAYLGKTVTEQGVELLF